MGPQRKKGKTINSKAREFIGRVILAFDEESRQGKLTHTVKQSNLRIAHTGIPARTITRIRRESAEAGETYLSAPGKHRERPEERNVHLDEFDKRVIRDIISEFYLVKTQAPTCPKLLPVLKEKINFPWGIHSLRNVL
jgi:hypothetical protein